MEKCKKAIGVVFVVVFAFLYAHIAKANNIYDKKVDNSEYQGTGVVCENAVEQRFVCSEDTLDGVKVKVQVIGDVQDVQLKYTLIDVQTRECVAEGIKEAANIQSSRFCEFPFDTVKNTKNKEYAVCFQNMNATEEKGIGFFFQLGIQENTKLLISDQQTEGTLILKTLTNRFDFETFMMVLIFIVYIVLFMKFLYRLFK